jgi:hypothetical protein
MDPTQWISAFRALHQRVKKAEATPQELEHHLAMREELARSLASAQGLTVPTGQNARRHFRVAQVFHIELNNIHRAVTRDISRSGFSALVPGDYKDGQEVSFSIVLARGEEPITGKGKVVASMKQQGSSRVSISVSAMSEASGERLEMALFDAALSRIK